MKQKDIAIIVMVAVVAGILSFLLSQHLFSTPKQRQQKVEVVTPITNEFPKPDSKYFNQASINPTQLIRIGNNSNTAPFNAPSE